jgi:hypothetical protein
MEPEELLGGVAILQIAWLTNRWREPLQGYGVYFTNKRIVGVPQNKIVPNLGLALVIGPMFGWIALLSAVLLVYLYYLRAKEIWFLPYLMAGAPVALFFALVIAPRIVNSRITNWKPKEVRFLDEIKAFEYPADLVTSIQLQSSKQKRIGHYRVILTFDSGRIFQFTSRSGGIQHAAKLIKTFCSLRPSIRLIGAALNPNNPPSVD